MPTAEFMATLPARVDYKLGLHKYMQHSSLPHNQVRLRFGFGFGFGSGFGLGLANPNPNPTRNPRGCSRA